MFKFGVEEATIFVKHFAAFMGFSLLGWFVSWLNLSLVGVLFICVLYSWKVTFEKCKRLQKQKTQLLFKNEKETIQEIFEELPRWVFFPDVERVEWLNKVSTRLWPAVTFYAKEFLKKTLEPSIQKSLPDKLNNFSFERIDLGDQPPRITGVKVYSQHTGEDEIIMDVNVFYAGDATVSVKISQLEAGVKDIQFKGTLRVVLKPLLRHPPFLGGIQLYFLTYPMLDFDLTDMASVLHIPGLYTLLRKTLLTQIANYLIIPNKLAMSLSQTVTTTELKFIEPKGVLMVQLLEAKNLVGHDLTSKSDPFVKTSVSAEEYCSKVKKNTHNPVWEDELYYFTVLETSGVNLEMLLYDKDDASKDDIMGSEDAAVSVPLSSLINNGYSDTWSDIADGEGSIHHICTWYSLTSDLSSLKPEVFSAHKKLPIMLSVYIDSAKNLQSFDGESSEPSSKVILSVASQKKSTWEVLSTPNPAYHQSFHFLLHHADFETLTMQVCDVDSDDVYGTASILLSEVIGSSDEMAVYRPFLLRGGSGFSEILVRISVKYLATADQLLTTADQLKKVDVEDDSNAARKPVVVGAAVAERTTAGTGTSAAPSTTHTIAGTAGTTGTGTAGTTGAGTTGTGTAGASAGAATTPSASVSSSPDTDSTHGSADYTSKDNQLSADSAGTDGTELRRRRASPADLPNVSQDMGVGRRRSSSGVHLKREVNSGDIELTVAYKKSHHKLVVIVHRCRELMKDMSSNITEDEAPNVYVKLYLMPDKSNKCKTEICKESFYPVFNQTFEFSVESGDFISSNLEIVVKRYESFFSKIEIGHVLLPLNDININKSTTKWYPLVHTAEERS